MSTGTDRPDGDLIAVGRVGPARGLHGAAYVEPWTDDPDERFAPGAVLRTEPAASGPLTVEESAQVSGKLVVQFAGVADRDAVVALRGTVLFISAADRPALGDPDDFYDTDLIGLLARTVAGEELGSVRDVLHAGGADYLVLDLAGREGAAREGLVPFIAAFVPSVDLAAGVVVVDPPAGLFEL